MNKVGAVLRPLTVLVAAAVLGTPLGGSARADDALIECERKRARGAIDIANNPTITLLREQFATSEVPSELTSLIEACGREAELSRDRSVAPYLCLGDAKLQRGRVNPAGPGRDLEGAFCDYQFAGKLAERADSAELQARAYEKQADALMALHQFAGANPAAPQLAEAIALYRRAEDLAASSPRRLAIANAYRLQNSVEEAEIWYRLALEDSGHPATSSASASTVQLDAQLALALSLRARRAAPADVERELLATQDLANRTGAAGFVPLLVARSTLGQHYFALEQYDRAVAEFEWLKANTRPNAPESSHYHAEALYYLGVMHFLGKLDGSSLSQAISHAEDAVETRSAPAYRRLACLGHIRRGRASVLNAQGRIGDDTDIVRWCQGGADTAEALLLRGMSFVRIAQFVPNIQFEGNREDWSDLLIQADQAFQAGAVLVPTADQSPLLVSWPVLADLDAPLNMTELFAFGADIVNSTERLRCGRDLEDDPRLATKEFFGNYNLLGCKP